MEHSTQPVSPSLKAEVLAAIIHAGYQAMLTEFLSNTAGAQRRFEQAAWHDVHHAIKNRNRLYKAEIARVYEAASVELGGDLQDLQLWRAAKDAYAELVNQSDNALIAQTFFNPPLAGHWAIAKYAMYRCLSATKNTRRANTRQPISCAVLPTLKAFEMYCTRP